MNRGDLELRQKEMMVDVEAGKWKSEFHIIVPVAPHVFPPGMLGAEHEHICAAEFTFNKAPDNIHELQGLVRNDDDGWWFKDSDGSVEDEFHYRVYLVPKRYVSGLVIHAKLKEQQMAKMNGEEMKAKATSASYRPKKGAKPAPSKAGRKVLHEGTEDLPVPLTDEELNDTGARLARLHEEASAHLAHSKDVKAALKARELEIVSQQAAMALRRNSGKIIKPVEIRSEADFHAGVVETIRMDTKEVIRTRPLTVAERQDSMFVDGEVSTKKDEDRPQTAEELRTILKLPHGVEPMDDEPLDEREDT